MLIAWIFTRSLVRSIAHFTSLSCGMFMDDSVVVPLEDIQVDDRLDYIERLVMILNKKTKTLRNKAVELVTIQW